MLHMVAFVLLVVGGLNWLLVGLLDLNIVAKVLSGMPAVLKIVYILVGLSALYEIFTHKAHCKDCST